MYEYEDVLLPFYFSLNFVHSIFIGLFHMFVYRTLSLVLSDIDTDIFSSFVLL